MSNHPIPEWATKPGATVILEPGGNRKDRQFLKATITRVTKSSVFVKVGKDGRERRFVTSSWLNDKYRMAEYGQSTAWGPGTYIWDPPSVAGAMEKARVRQLELKVAKAASDLAGAINGQPGRDYNEQIETLRFRIAEYEAGK
jgi:hypothetical protein